ncbi:phosphatidylserine/phosphatidylglycerophosphate/cardiolipin synthase-like enzyme [Bradyrhizobium sp. USDA 4508]
MRANGRAASPHSMRARAIAGIHVVTIGVNMDKSETEDLLGFGFHRTDVTENEAYWLEGQKRFKILDPGLPPGKGVPTNKHPIQSFLWADFTAKGSHDYVYKVVAIRGTPDAPKETEFVELQVKTEAHDAAETHDVFFNRGAIASQAYAQRFENRDPDEVGPEAYQWLSRGLHEALIEFIGKAKDPSFALRAAIYEFQYPDVLDAFHNADAAGADVKIIYDAKSNPKGPRKRNEEAIKAELIKSLCIPRTANPSYIAHNKFIVLLKNGAPIEVWTGSTNVTTNGIFGHLNAGHVVRDTAIASQYLEYWTDLSDDPEARDIKPKNVDKSPAPTTVGSGATVAVFSPRSNLKALDWYVDLMAKARQAAFLTGAFGVPAPFVDLLKTDTEVVRYILLEKPGQGADAPAILSQIRAVRSNQIVVGPPKWFSLNAFDDWLEERKNPFSENVEYIHTKFMLVDPLGDDPWVVAGSANFSTASTNQNDENMLVIRGDGRVVDIYLGEFMRIYNHLSFRSWAAGKSKEELNKISFLDTTGDWVGDFYKPGTRRTLQREYFCE